MCLTSPLPPSCMPQRLLPDIRMPFPFHVRECPSHSGPRPFSNKINILQYIPVSCTGLARLDLPADPQGFRGENIFVIPCSWLRHREGCVLLGTGSPHPARAQWPSGLPLLSAERVALESLGEAPRCHPTKGLRILPSHLLPNPPGPEPQKYS